MHRILALAILVLACTGCTSAVVAAREGVNRPNKVFNKALAFDQQCIALPFVVLNSGPNAGSIGEDPRIGLAILGSAFVYGVIDIPFTYSAYSLYRVQDFAREKYQDLKSW